MSDNICTECKALVASGEYHPFSFCVLKKAGYDPWNEIRTIVAQIGLEDPGDKPPRVFEIHTPGAA